MLRTGYGDITCPNRFLVRTMSIHTPCSHSTPFGFSSSHCEISVGRRLTHLLVRVGSGRILPHSSSRSVRRRSSACLVLGGTNDIDQIISMEFIMTCGSRFKTHMKCWWPRRPRISRYRRYQRENVTVPSYRCVCQHSSSRRLLLDEDLWWKSKRLSSVFTTRHHR